MRGTGRVERALHALRRFSPARAGNGGAGAAARLGGSVQPRACGERASPSGSAGYAAGSAPRVRGTVGARQILVDQRRFSPARAGNGTRIGAPQCASAVQPRACGERCAKNARGRCWCGSAPRVRGTVRARLTQPEVFRFSPARAGNGRPAARAGGITTVQPRACGERLGAAIAASIFAGSAPRVRGTVGQGPPHCRGGRFSPARAGNGRPISAAASDGPVQPRACGERAPPARPAAARSGSAPRVRGTGRPGGPGGGVHRFSPARAGNGRAGGRAPSLAPVQPRACGERPASVDFCSRAAGSAPRVRGTAHRGDQRAGGDRFSPARAGNGAVPCRPSTRRSVQPRACGERGAGAAGDAATDGSAPRVRGTAILIVAVQRRPRFSPARAGNGSGASWSLTAPPVQPRACGERRRALIQLPPHLGSAPRVRGTARQHRRAAGNRRFSPARAGNGTCPASWTRYTPVQPRACGERANATSGQCTVEGSAPRVRGTVLLYMSRISKFRFSPARAGNGQRPYRKAGREAVQPRACGERARYRVEFSITTGSAPRVRGTDCRRSSRSPSTRFSPARAGNGRAGHGERHASAVQPRACGERLATRHHVGVGRGSAPRVRGTAWVDARRGIIRRFSPARAGNGPFAPEYGPRTAVQPRACGERSFWIVLIIKDFHDVKERTRNWRFRARGRPA